VSGPFGQGRASKLVVEQQSKSNTVDRQVLELMGFGDEEMTKIKDKSRKWMWWFLGVVAALQFFYVRELLAAFALFALGFAVIAFVFGSLYMLHRGWVVAVERLAESKHPVMVAARQSVYTIEDMARRPFRRPGSATAR
jgi:hypothetical protein